ncbi:MAG: hypothetical protein WDO56_23890 [Gammaproteobacteria bacterium]
MKIALVCSCLEPGRDGVGDYSVRLAVELIARGHRAFVIAERDFSISTQEPVHGERENVRVLRLPARASNESRGRWLAEGLADFSPDWVVLQFVCWGFADRGILDPPPVALLAALSGRRVAIYCHELWLGLKRGASLRHRWWGRRQRVSILRFLTMLRPAVVLTSNPAYREVLHRYDWNAEIVPLFSNVPVHAGAASTLLPLLHERAGKALWESRSDVLMLAVFGSVYPEWKPEAALRWFQSEAQRRNRRVVVVSAGRLSQKGEAVLASLARKTDLAVGFVTLGEVSAEAVSGLLQEADLGLPATEWVLLGKSGVAAAMMAHGLPMLVVRSTESFRDLPGLKVTYAPQVFAFDAAAPPDFDTIIGARARVGETLPQIASQFLRALERAPATV